METSPTSKRMRKVPRPRETLLAHSAFKALSPLSPRKCHDWKDSAYFEDKVRKYCHPVDEGHATQNFQSHATKSISNRKRFLKFSKDAIRSRTDTSTTIRRGEQMKVDCRYRTRSGGLFKSRTSSRSQSTSRSRSRSPSKSVDRNGRLHVALKCQQNTCRNEKRDNFNHDDKNQPNGKSTFGWRGLQLQSRKYESDKSAEICLNLTKTRSGKCQKLYPPSLKKKRNKEYKGTFQGKHKSSESKPRRGKRKSKSPNISSCQCGQCESCKKERMIPIVTPLQENRVLLSGNLSDHPHSIFQRVPFLKVYDKEEINRRETSENVVLHSLFGKGAFHAYSKAADQMDPGPAPDIKEDLNTNRSVISSDFVVFPPNPYHFVKGRAKAEQDNPGDQFSKMKNTPLSTDTTESGRDCDEKEESHGEAVRLNSNVLPSFYDGNDFLSSKWTYRSPGSRDNNLNLGKNVRRRCYKHSDLYTHVFTKPYGHCRHNAHQHRLQPRAACEIEKPFSIPHLHSHRSKNFTKMEPRPYMDASEMAVDEQLNQLNSLLQEINQQNKSDRFKSSVKYHICGTYPSSFDSDENESVASDMRDRSREQTESLSDYEDGGCNKIVEEKSETSPEENPIISTIRTTNRIRRKRRQRQKNVREGESVGFYCKGRAPSPPQQMNDDFKDCVPRSTMSDIYRTSNTESNSVEKDKRWESYERHPHYINKSPCSDNKPITAPVSPETPSHNERVTSKRRKWTARHEPYRCLSRGCEVKNAPVLDAIDSVYTCFQKQALVKELKPIAKSYAIKENIFDGVDMHSFFQNMRNLEREDVLSSSCEALPENKNNCSPSRNTSHVDSVDDEKKATVPRDPQPSEITNSVGFEAAIEDSLASGSNENKEETYSIEKPMLTTVPGGIGDNFENKHNFSRVFPPQTPGSNENMPFDDQRARKEDRMPDETPIMHSPAEESKENRKTRPIVTFFDADKRNNFREKSHSKSPSSETRSRICSREAVLVDHGIQTSPSQTVGVAVQTSFHKILFSNRRAPDEPIPQIAKRLTHRPLNDSTRTASVSDIETSPSEAPSLEFITYMDKGTQTQGGHENCISHTAPPDPKDLTGEHHKDLPKSLESFGSSIPSYLVSKDPAKGNDSSHCAISNSSECSQLGEALLSASTSHNTTQEFNSSILMSSNSTLDDLGSKFSYLARPNWSNVKVEEIDKRVKRALQLRQELQKTRSRQFRPSENLSNNLKEKPNFFLPLTKSTPHPKLSNPSTSEEISNLSDLPTLISFRQSFQNKCNANSTMLPNMLSTPKGLSGVHDEERFKTTQSLSTREEKPKHSCSQSPSLCSLPRSSPAFRSSSGSASTKLQRSHSFPVQEPFDVEQKTQSSAYEVPFFSQQEVKLKRIGSHDKNSPPTKISRMENMLSDCPHLLAELVQKLPKVPLTSFVEWFIETSNPSQSTLSVNSAGSTATGGFAERERPHTACPVMAKSISIIEGKNDNADAARQGSHPNDTEEQTYPFSCQGDLSLGESVQACSKNKCDQPRTTRNQRSKSRAFSQSFSSSLVEGNRESATSKSTADPVQYNDLCKAPSHRESLNLEDNVRRTIIAIRKSSDVSGIVTKFSCRD